MFSHYDIKKINEISSNPEVRDCAERIASILRGHYTLTELKEMVVISAYALSLVSICDYPFFDLDKVVDLINEDNSSIAYRLKSMKKETWEKLNSLATSYTPETFAAVVLRPIEDDENGTPDSIIRLALELLDISKDDQVLDICCGSGCFLTQAHMKEDEASLYGIELNANAATVAMAKQGILGNDMHIEICDAFFKAIKENLVQTKYNKIFSNYPFGLRFRGMEGGDEYFNTLSSRFSGISRATSSDWLFNSLMLDFLADGGRAIGIMTNGSTWNTIDSQIRRFFVENGYIESVIALPPKMFENTSIPTSMIVLSKGNNSSVRLIDATSLCEIGRRQNTFTQEQIEQIVKSQTLDSDISCQVSLDTLRKNEYVLNPSRYLRDKIVIKDPVPLESVITEISRGAQVRASELDDMVSDIPTNVQYLMLGNIQHGVIDKDLPYLTSLDEKLEKYCLKNNDLILSKNGYPYKVAVAQVEDGQKILANGNMYIIRVDEEKIQPYFLKAFFESEQGIASLKSITVGATIPNMGVKDLKKLSVPMPSMEEQQAFLEKYLAKVDEIKLLELKLEKARQSLRHLFDETEKE